VAFAGAIVVTLLGCELTHRLTTPSESAQQQPQRRVVSDRSGSRTAGGYDRAREAEIAAVEAISRSEREAAILQLQRAEEAAGNTLEIVAGLRSSGEWVDDLLYETRHDGVLDEVQILAGLRRIHADAHAARLSLADAPTIAGSDASPPTPTAEPDVSPQTRTHAPTPEPTRETPVGQREAPASDAPTPEQQRALYFSTTFAAGQCRFGDCLEQGWTLRADGGTHESRCNFGNCLKDGWTTSHPRGSSSRTSCRFGKCSTDGWTTSHPDGRTSTTSCRFNDCFKDGWQTSYPDGSSSSTSCNFNKCATDGWTTRFSDGRSIRCTCRFNDCLENGSTCG
jgi:hypothetical protein